VATLEFDGVSKVYGNEVWAVRDLNLVVNDGEFVVLVGRPGCGKTTALRMVAGLEAITGGEIRIAGVRVNDVQPWDRDIAMVFQNYALYPQMNDFPANDHLAPSGRSRRKGARYDPPPWGWRFPGAPPERGVIRSVSLAALAGGVDSVCLRKG
jgi:ABC-type polar amino acid transport system ATPase subunit